jgi:hypothetical protein
VVNRGLLDVGDPLDILFVEGDYSQLTSGLLEIQIGGLLAGDEYNVLDLTGTASLAGSLLVSLVDPADPLNGSNPFSPQPGDVFDILVAATISDTGLSLTLPGFPDFRAWDAAIVDTSPGRQAFRLTVIPEPTTALLLGLGLAGLALRRRLAA